MFAALFRLIASVQSIIHPMPQSPVMPIPPPFIYDSVIDIPPIDVVPEPDYDISTPLAVSVEPFVVETNAGYIGLLDPSTATPYPRPGSDMRVLVCHGKRFLSANGDPAHVPASSILNADELVADGQCDVEVK